MSLPFDGNRRWRHGFAASFMATLLLGACSLAPSRDDIASYDFGNPPENAAAIATGGRLSQPILLFDAVAPAWMDTAQVHYRLAYQDAARPRAYANSRWVMPPATLFTNRLRQRFAAAGGAGVLIPADGVRAANALKLEIEEFTQVFDAPGRSRAVLRARATLLGSRALLAQRTFSLERPAVTADADGGVRALVAACDDLIAQLLDWTAANAKN